MRYAMRTTIDIPDADLKEAMKYMGTRTKRETVVKALTEFNRRERMRALVQHSGTCHFSSNEELEAMEP